MVVVAYHLAPGTWYYGLDLNHIQQHFAARPSVPTRLLSNCTSATGYVLAFLSSILVQALAYFISIFFQAVKGTTIHASGVKFLPMAIETLVFVIIAKIMLSHFGSLRSGFSLASMLTHQTWLGLGTSSWPIWTLVDHVGTPAGRHGWST